MELFNAVIDGFRAVTRFLNRDVRDLLKRRGRIMDKATLTEVVNALEAVTEIEGFRRLIARRIEVKCAGRYLTRDELLSVAMENYEFMKNHGRHGA